MSVKIVTPACPMCDQPPIWVLAEGRQCWCGNDDCTVLIWDATKTLDENLLDARSVDLTAGTDSNKEG